MKTLRGDASQQASVISNFVCPCVNDSRVFGLVVVDTFTQLCCYCLFVVGFIVFFCPKRLYLTSHFSLFILGSAAWCLDRSMSKKDGVYIVHICRNDEFQINNVVNVGNSVDICYKNENTLQL